LNVLQLHWHLPNLVKYLTGAGLGQINEKLPDSGFAELEVKSGTALKLLLLTCLLVQLAASKHSVI